MQQHSPTLQGHNNLVQKPLSCHCPLLHSTITTLLLHCALIQACALGFSVNISFHTQAKSQKTKDKVARMSPAMRAIVYAMRNPPKGIEKAKYSEIQKVSLHTLESTYKDTCTRKLRSRCNPHRKRCTVAFPSHERLCSSVSVSCEACL